MKVNRKGCRVDWETVMIISVLHANVFFFSVAVAGNVKPFENLPFSIINIYWSLKGKKPTHVQTKGKEPS